MKNKIITSEGNIQFIDSEGKVINISPSQVYSVINEDTVSFILVHLPKSSGLSLFTTKVEDLELNGATYSQSTIADALAEAFSEAGAVGRIEVVDELPSEGKTNTIYLLPKDEGEGYDEYIYIKDESKWELIGDTSVEIKNYLKKSDFNEYSAATKTAIDSKQDALIAGKHISISGNVISAEDVDLSDYYTKSETSGATEISTALNAKQDTLVAGDNITISGNVISAEVGVTVDTALDSGSTNSVENRAIWSAATYNKGVLLTFNGRDSTNYPEGCGKLVVENNGNFGVSGIHFINDEGREVGIIFIRNFDNISVDTSSFEGASYEIDGTTVIISYPSTGITSVEVNETKWTYTAVVEGAWVNENTYMKAEIDAIANGLQNNINAKLDATAYTPTVVDSALNVVSQNPVQNQALYSELRFPNGETETTLSFENEESTNYPNGCTKLIVEVAGSNNISDIEFYNNNQKLGRIHIDNSASIFVDVRFDGASYVISGTTVIINYPTVTSVTKIRVNGNGDYVYKAIAALATPLKDQVVANTNKIDEIEDRISEDEEVTAAALNELNEELAGKQVTLVSGTNIKTINNESILGSGNIDIQGGSGAIDQSLDSGSTNAISNAAVSAALNKDFYFLYNVRATPIGGNAYKEAELRYVNPYTSSTAMTKVLSFATINNNGIVGVNSDFSLVETSDITTSVTSSSTDAQVPSAKAVYDALQEGGSSITVDTALDSGSTNPVENRVIYNKIDEVEQVTAAGLNALNDNFGGLKLVKLSQAEYSALAVKDSQTLYIIVG